MKIIKAEELQAGQWYNAGRGWHKIARVEKYETGVMVFLASEVENPFISSQFASYGNNVQVQVYSYPP